MFRHSLKTARRKLFQSTENRIIEDLRLASRTSAETKISQRHIYHYYRNLAKIGHVPALNETGFRNFSQFEEDGILLCIFALLEIPYGYFVDIGSADGINSNCANLALNFGWHGLFIDGAEENIRRGREFYSRHPDSFAFPPKFSHTMIKRENINDILKAFKVPADADLISIDIDGNDYWVWEAIECNPKVVIIETHIELGERSIVVPYDKDFVHPGGDDFRYFGASAPAMVKLANKKGYRLVGANSYGFNTIYVRRGLGETLLPEVPVESILRHPRNLERLALCEPIKDKEFVVIS